MFLQSPQLAPCSSRYFQTNNKFFKNFRQIHQPHALQTSIFLPPFTLLCHQYSSGYQACDLNTSRPNKKRNKGKPHIDNIPSSRVDRILGRLQTSAYGLLFLRSSNIPLSTNHTVCSGFFSGASSRSVSKHCKHIISHQGSCVCLALALIGGASSHNSINYCFNSEV